MQLKRVVKTACALMLALLFIANGIAESDYAPLTLKDKNGPMPDPGNYTSDRSYADETITVDIFEGKEYGTVYLYAHIKIKDPSQIRTAAALSYGSKHAAMAPSIAKKVNAVAALNSDSFAFRDYGYVVRQGKRYRNKPTGQDLLVLDSNGELTGLYAATKKSIEAFYSSLPQGTEVWHVFSFGPILVQDGKSVVADNIRYFNIGSQNQAQRACIAQIAPLEYLIVSSEGPEDPDGNGMTIPQFAKVVEAAGYLFNENGVKIAYNLDGGTSNTLVFGNKQINSPNNAKKRSVTEIIYFATLVQAR